MYERNAIVIDRYFGNLFGYDQNSNLKNNSTNYFELVEKFERYQIASENENNVMLEFEAIANQIKETQKLQEILNKRNMKYLESRKNLFENLEEESQTLKYKFDKVADEIVKNDEEIKSNIEKFVEEIEQFHQKTEVRTESGRERRIVESDYQKCLEKSTENFNRISKDRLREIKTFIKLENKDSEKEKIKEKILKNGAKEKIPFDERVINKAIDVSTDIEQKKVEILLSIYDKMGKLLDEIKNDNVKIERHKKIVRDSKSKLEYLSVISEYVIQFLDNERMNLIGGKEEHEENMLATCENVQKDLVQIQNMYSLLIKEITEKSTKKAYKELYKKQYLIDLQQAEKNFEANVSKLNIAGSVIYPDYWRVETMQKIYDTFKRLITEVYEKDISEYEPEEIKVQEEVLNQEEDDDDIIDNWHEKEEEPINKEETEDKENEEEKEEEEEENTEEEPQNDDIFEWDDDEFDDELNFDDGEVFEDENEQDLEDIDIENESDDEFENETIDSQENKRDKEIDKILGFFDEESDDTEDIDFDDTSLEEEDNFDDLIDLDDLEKMVEKEEQNIKQKQEERKGKESIDKRIEKKMQEKAEKNHKKKSSLFGRKKK